MTKASTKPKRSSAKNHKWNDHLRKFREENKELLKGKSCVYAVKLARKTYMPKPKCKLCGK
jgi:hypothetical protein